MAGWRQSCMCVLTCDAMKRPWFRDGYGAALHVIVCVGPLGRHSSAHTGLCHDLGHGPLSHPFENFLKRRGITDWCGGQGAAGRG